jgi:hypothetical protein
LDKILNGWFKFSCRKLQKAKKRGPPDRSRALYKCEGQKTSRGEQLLRWNWEEKATMCISYVRYDGLLCSEQRVFVQSSHASGAGLLSLKLHDCMAVQSLLAKSRAFSIEK